MAMFELSIENRVATLSMRRPEKRNAIANSAWRELAACAEEIGQSSAKMVLLCSAVDGIFSAGADIGEFTMPGDGEPRDLAGPMRSGLDALAALSIPTVAHVDGGCFGAGVALILACDIRLAGADARFGVPPAKLGLAYPAEDLARLAAAVGRAQAARLIFSGENIDREEALRIGLVQMAANGAAVGKFCNGIAANSASSLATLKSLLDRGIAGRFDAESRNLFTQSFQSDDFASGLAAYHAGERPVFE
ncbi:MAG: enoyl-CoA hydratase/isomerase family protein [Sphingomonadaceae bacterium]|nr:enoyl-CoA hydratase/isomerase family protein [Sphingomonadaceae bacterium]